MTDVTEQYEYRNLLIGCGHARDKRMEPRMFGLPAVEQAKRINEPKIWRGRLETLDSEPRCKPHIYWNLNAVPWCDDKFQPLPANHYHEVHAYEVLEHLGTQGDYHAFFAVFSEIWRVLKPDGFLCATVPSRKSVWLWGDPGHTRAIPQCALVFLNQQAYKDQQGKTSMSDYRRVYQADFETLYTYDNGETHSFVLQAVKPSRAEKEQP